MSPLSLAILLMLQVFFLVLSTIAPPTQTLIPFFAGYAAAFLLASIAPRLLPDISARAVFFSAAILRLAILFTPVRMSDDLYRYLWEGRALLLGVDPYQVAPASPSLSAIPDPYRSLVNHPELTAIYPPGALGIFALLAALWYHPLLFRAVASLAELAVVWLLLRRDHDGAAPSPAEALAYAWHPLPVLEFAGSGHMDSLAIVWLVAAVQARSIAFTSVWLGMGAALKYLPATLLPALLPRWKSWSGQRLAPFLLAAVPGVLSLVLVGPGPLKSIGLHTYVEHWDFNASIFRLLTWVLEPGQARMLCGVLFLWVALQPMLRPVSPARQAFRLTAAFFLLSPTAHPWYLCWSLPFARLWDRSGWWLLSGTCGAAYWVFQGPGGWQEDWTVTAGLYTIPLLLSLWRFSTHVHTPVHKPVDNS